MVGKNKRGLKVKKLPPAAANRKGLILEESKSQRRKSEIRPAAACLPRDCCITYIKIKERDRERNILFSFSLNFFPNFIFVINAILLPVTQEVLG